MNKYIYTIMTVIIILLVAVVGFQSKSIQEQKAAVDSLSLWNDSTRLELEGQEAANVVLEDLTEEQFEQIIGLEGDKLRLQEMVKEEKRVNMALASRIQVLLQETHATDTITYEVVGDTAYAVYNTVFTDEWRDVSIRAGRDSTSLKMILFANLDFISSLERSKGLFSRKVPVVKASTDNPYVSFSGLESVQFEGKSSRLGLDIAAVIGVDLNLAPVIGIGIGIGYRIRDF